ncbi:MAG: NUDIX hydrolase [Thermodesulfovibrio sp.]|nr:NUDIX hydrolase [Thermodesulfovibrio sp.]
MKPAIIKHFNSAGGIIFKRVNTGIEVALIATKNKTVWTLPKGLIDKGESSKTTAVREVTEETGLTGRIIDTLGDKSYWFYLKDENAKCKKTVTYFLLEYISGSIDDYCWEVDEARWFNIKDAANLVSYKSDSEMLEKAKEMLSKKYGEDIKLE